MLIIQIIEILIYKWLMPIGETPYQGLIGQALAGYRPASLVVCLSMMLPFLDFLFPHFLLILFLFPLFMNFIIKILQ